MYTDGLIECMKNGINLYDRKQLRKGIMTHGKLNADNILKQILADRSKLIGNLPPEDDVTVVILESTPGVRASA
jgi:serine phosphatase RsbU (regulator of sigma subunit)